MNMFFTGVPFTIIIWLLSLFLYDLKRGIIQSIFTGLIFSVMMSVFLKVQKQNFAAIKHDITKGKDIIIEGGANHFKGIESVGGWFYLTSDELIFKSHKFNFQNHRLELKVNQIKEVKPIFTFGFIPNGLQIITKNGQKEKFVVHNRKAWVQKINDIVLIYRNHSKLTI